MGWLVTALILLLLAVLPLGVSVSYDEKGPLVKIIAGPLHLTVYPRTGKPEKNAPPKKQKASEPAAKTPSDEPLPQPPKPPKHEKTREDKPKGGSLTDFFPFVKLGLDFLGDLRRKLRLDRLELKLILAGGDPCDLALNYGKTWAAIGNLLPRLERLFVIKKRDIEAECDFTASQTLITARLDLTITLGRILSLVVCYAIRALCEYWKFKKKRKGGAVT